MAITQCPECGGKVSTRATVCPHCGYPVGPQITCPDCGENFAASLTACPECAGPVEAPEDPQELPEPLTLAASPKAIDAGIAERAANAIRRRRVSVHSAMTLAKRIAAGLGGALLIGSGMIGSDSAGVWLFLFAASLVGCGGALLLAKQRKIAFPLVVGSIVGATVLAVLLAIEGVMPGMTAYDGLFFGAGLGMAAGLINGIGFVGLSYALRGPRMAR